MARHGSSGDQAVGEPSVTAVTGQDVRLGTQLGVITFISEQSGNGFIRSGPLRSAGFPQDAFASSVPQRFRLGMAVQFVAFTDSRKVLRARDLQALPSGPFAVGSRVVAGEAWDPFQKGSIVEVLHIGDSPQDAGWIFGKSLDIEQGPAGWVPLSAVARVCMRPTERWLAQSSDDGGDAPPPQAPLAVPTEIIDLASGLDPKTDGCRCQGCSGKGCWSYNGDAFKRQPLRIMRRQVRRGVRATCGNPCSSSGSGFCASCHSSSACASP